METKEAVKRYLCEKTEELTSDLPKEHKLEILDHMIEHHQKLKAAFEWHEKEEKLPASEN